jgi:hypothetical protein
MELYRFVNVCVKIISRILYILSQYICDVREQTEEHAPDRLAGDHVRGV